MENCRIFLTTFRSEYSEQSFGEEGNSESLSEMLNGIISSIVGDRGRDRGGRGE